MSSEDFQVYIDEVYNAPPYRPCQCGCGRPAAEGSKYASSGCRNALFALQHPRVDLSGLSPEAAKRAKRLLDEAVRAAKEGLERATVDMTHEVKHQRDERPSNRLRLSGEGWDLADLLAALWGCSRSRAAERAMAEVFGRLLREADKEVGDGQNP